MSILSAGGRCAFGPPGCTFPCPMPTHIQARQPPAGCREGRDGRRGGKKDASGASGRRKTPLKHSSSTPVINSTHGGSSGHGRGRGREADDEEEEDEHEGEGEEGGSVRLSPTDHETIAALQRTVSLLRLEIDTYKGQDRDRDDRLLAGAPLACLEMRPACGGPSLPGTPTALANVSSQATTPPQPPPPRRRPRHRRRR